MLEIIAIILLCKKNKANAAARGRSPGGAVGLTIGLWVGLELVGAMIGSAANMKTGAYLLALLFGVIGGAISYLIAKNVGPKRSAAGTQAVRPAQAAGGYIYCAQCGGKMPPQAAFCPVCGAKVAARPATAAQQTFAAVPAQAPAAQRTSAVAPAQAPAAQRTSAVAPAQAAASGDRFYVFAVQGPAFGASSGDMVLEKAKKLKDGYEPAGNMELALVRPSMWNARVKSSSNSGVVSVSYSMDGFKVEIERYLAAQGVPAPLIRKGIALSETNQLQLSNPMSGVFVMGIPIAAEPEKAEPVAAEPAEPEKAEPVAAEPAEPEKAEPVAAEPAEPEKTEPVAAEPAEPEKTEPVAAPAPCQHQYQHNACVKCGAKAPKPALVCLGRRTQGQYTYEDYRADNAEQARYFLELTDVSRPLFYVMVHTPEGTWGKDKDGLFLESLCAFQRNLSLAQCKASAALLPERMQDLQMAARKITDNYLLSVTCGACRHEWKDGVAYCAKTVVKCPACGKFNLVDTENIRYNNL